MNEPKPSASKDYRIATLESLSPSQIAAVRAIPAHGAVAPKSIEARRPASFFLDEANFKREQEQVFRRLPVAVTLASLVPEPGSAIAHNGYGLPLLVVRGKDNVVRTFLNVCQHKGALLVEHCDPMKASRFTCPYHAWTYALDGRLVGVAREESFKNLDKNTRNLPELPCKEAGGIIWAILDRDAKPDFSLLHPQIIEDLDALGIGSSHVYGRRTFDVAANWKLVLEPFLEGYHVTRLHARTVGPMFADVPNISEVFGDHIRQVSGRVEYDPGAGDAAGENIHKLVTHAYQLFPCTVVITSPYYISVMVILPVDAHRSRVDYYMTVHEKPANEKAEAVYARSLELIYNVFGGEDFRAAEISQVGLSSGALKDLVYCGLEENIPTYYEILDRRLGA